MKPHTLLVCKLSNACLCLLFSLSDWCRSISEKYLPAFRSSFHPELAWPLFCHSSKMAACEQPPRGSAVEFPLHLSSLRKLRTPLSLPTLKEQSTTNLFLWHIEVLLHYNPCSLVFFFLCWRNSGQLLYRLFYNREWWRFNTISHIIVQYVRIILFRFTEVNKGLF